MPQDMTTATVHSNVKEGRHAPEELADLLLRGLLLGFAISGVFLHPVVGLNRYWLSITITVWAAANLCVFAFPRSRKKSIGQLHLFLVLFDISMVLALAVTRPSSDASFVLPSILLLGSHGVHEGKVGTILSTAAGLIAVVAMWGPSPYTVFLWWQCVFGVVIVIGTGWVAAERRSFQRSIEEMKLSINEDEERLTMARCNLKEMRDQLSAAERLSTIGQMSAQMAHQVRNPLSSISLNMEMLDEEIAELPPERHKNSEPLVHAIHEEIETLAELTENYLQYARLPSLKLRPGSLNAVVEDLLHFLRAEMDRHGVSATRVLSPDVKPILLDRRQFRVALSNLVRNSLEALEGEGGSIRLTTHAANGNIVLTLSDTGPGIPEENLERIFEPFFTTKERGSGLGLTLTQQIVRMHRGELKCQSLTGVGTMFSILLPALSQDELQARMRR